MKTNHVISNIILLMSLSLIGCKSFTPKTSLPSQTSNSTSGEGLPKPPLPPAAPANPPAANPTVPAPPVVVAPPVVMPPPVVTPPVVIPPVVTPPPPPPPTPAPQPPVPPPVMPPTTPPQGPGASQGGPGVFFTDILSGPKTGGPNGLGSPISIFGRGFGATRGSSKVTIGGVEVASYMVWGEKNANNPTLDLIVVQPGPNSNGGPIVVTVNGKSSNSDITFTVNSGSIYYIARNGADSAACSEAQPCANIAHLMGKMKPGDITLIRAGEYSESEIWIRGTYGMSGTADQRKVVKNYPGEVVTYSNAARPIIVDASYITLSGLRLLNGKSIGVDQTGNRMINNFFDGTISWDAIGTHGDDHVLAGNHCDVKGSTVGTQGHCYYISYGNNLKLLYNIGAGAPGYGIHIFDQARQANDRQRVMSNILVEGNILKNSTQRSGLIMACADEQGKGNKVDGIIVRNNIIYGNSHIGITIAGYCLAQNILIANNTLYENGRQGIFVAGGPNNKNITIKNNLVVQSENNVCRNDCSWYKTAHVQLEKPSDTVIANNNGFFGTGPALLGLTDSAQVSGNANFVNTTIFDLRILPGSSAIDKGVSISEVPRDYDGKARPQGNAPDLGAFELLP